MIDGRCGLVVAPHLAIYGSPFLAVLGVHSLGDRLRGRVARPSRWRGAAEKKLAHCVR
jgi:hypothetical protein